MQRPRAEDAVNAVELLKQDHKELKKMLKTALEAEGSEEREDMLDHVRSELVRHERIEEEIFYPRLKSDEKTKEIVLEGYEEHHVADVILDELLEIPPTSELWKAKVKVLKENIEHHIKEEEDEMFPKARRILSSDQLEHLGERMEALKKE